VPAGGVALPDAVRPGGCFAPSHSTWRAETGDVPSSAMSRKPPGHANAVELSLRTSSPQNRQSGFNDVPICKTTIIISPAAWRGRLAICSATGCRKDTGATRALRLSLFGRSAKLCPAGTQARTRYQTFAMLSGTAPRGCLGRPAARTEDTVGSPKAGIQLWRFLRWSRFLTTATEWIKQWRGCSEYVILIQAFGTTRSGKRRSPRSHCYARSETGDVPYMTLPAG
jgi:hypothetical protein